MREISWAAFIVNMFHYFVFRSVEERTSYMKELFFIQNDHVEQFVSDIRGTNVEV